MRRGAGSNLRQRGGGRGEGQHLENGHINYFPLANQQKSLTLKNSLSLLNLYDWKMDCHGTERVVHSCFRQYI